MLAFAALVDLLLGDQQARKEERNVQVAVGATPTQLFRQVLVDHQEPKAAHANQANQLRRGGVDLAVDQQQVRPQVALR